MVDPWPLFGLMVWAWTTSLIMAFLLGMGFCRLCCWPRQSQRKDESGGTVMRHSTSWNLAVGNGGKALHGTGERNRAQSTTWQSQRNPLRQSPKDSEGHRLPDLRSRGDIAVVTPPRPTPGGRDSSLEGLRAWEEHHVMESEMPNPREGAARTRDRNPSRALEMMLEGASPEANRHWMA